MDKGSCEGIVFNIQSFSLYDGPGIRTNIFFQGCALDCAWCHNPEGKNVRGSLSLDTKKCVMCGKCAAICPNHIMENGVHTVDREKCTLCGKCAKECLWGALEFSAKKMTVQEIIDRVIREKPFFDESGGGITLTGGEPMLQPRFAIALAQAAKEKGISVCMETAGFCGKEELLAILPSVDRFLYDWKCTDDETHRRYTGHSNRVIAENLAALDNAGAVIELRCPIIPGVNITEEHFRGIIGLAKRNKNIVQITLEGYHPLGNDKAQRIGAAPFGEKQTFPREELQNIGKQLQKYSPVPVVLSS